ncbi:transmembrane anchor protein [uncultured Phenylobacterium sp.]|uniref:transmembrane anchor protein n=1 Tax=uncultured Phenylobacterium sp. TaxID=349273 RepID=UPI0025E45F76|nr:transmembrane anchor protein [uncultured Phenylobacterium sp.]
MYDAERPLASELPSSARLLRSTAMAAGVAGVLLVTTVLPAEYAIDPTGIGRLLGLTQMGEVKVALAAEAELADAQPVPQSAPATALATAQVAAPAAGATPHPPHEVSLTLAPNQAAEIKVEMRKGATIRYLWSTDGPRVNFDTHGDGAGIKYHGYAKGSEVRSQGSLTAAFDGSHGWYWRNRSGQSATVTLRVDGDYIRVKRVV